MRAYEIAAKTKRRTFHEKSTGSIRCYPENYCLAVEILNAGKLVWRAYNDRAVKPHRDKIQQVIDCYQFDTPETIAEKIATVIPQVNF